MISKTERDSAMDMVSTKFIKNLLSWVSKERSNLDSYIVDPLSHVDYNPYAIVNIGGLEMRSGFLLSTEEDLNIIVSYREGAGATKTQHDTSLDDIYSVFLERLLSWMELQKQKMLDMASQRELLRSSNEYTSLYSFDEEKFYVDLKELDDSINGIKIVIQYAKETLESV
jgi:hypothetical protein